MANRPTRDAGGPAASIDALQKAVRANPLDRRLLANLAGAQISAGRYEEGFDTYNRLIALGDVSAATWARIGDALHAIQEFAQAAKVFEQSLSLGDTPMARHGLGRSLFKLGDIDGAVGHLEKAARESGNLAAWLALATIIPGAPSASQDRILQIRREFADILDAASKPAAPRRRPRQRPRADGAIRVGYVSSWFGSANYMKPVWALINHHDRAQVEVHLFSDSDADTEMEGYAANPRDRLHPTGSLDNAALARTIADLGIDILVDLNGYSTPERLGLFAAAPAPVSLAWFNMYATSGLPGFDGIVGDAEVVKPSEGERYSETVHRLPVSYLTFTTAHRTPPVADPPSLSNGHITFGSLVAQYKITSGVVTAWAEILKAVPGSRLFLANRALDKSQNRAWVAARFAEAGIDSARITFRGAAPHYEYLQNYDQIDVALDAFPYNGGTTTMEAIWQGVPVLTFDGDRWASRTSTTLLRRTHLGDFVHASQDAMVRSAIDMARDPETPAMLRRLRHGMRSELERSPVCDAAALARAMEALYASLAA